MRRVCFILFSIAMLPFAALAGSPKPSHLAVVQTLEFFPKTQVKLKGMVDYHITSAAEPVGNGTINLVSPDAWLFLDAIPPSRVAATVLRKVSVDGAAASTETNARIVQYGVGSVIIPQGPNYAGMTIFDRPNYSGTKSPLQCYVKYGQPEAESGNDLGPAVRSFKLKRGYMATLAQNPDGTGVSSNIVAQDFDLEIPNLPKALDGKVHFIRVFPWRWVCKKGVAGDIYQSLNVGWYYDWNISHESTADLEYVPIKQSLHFPDLAHQDWKKRGSDMLLGFNEPDHKDQANLTVEQALAAWPELMHTGLRLGSPAVSDGGVKWLLDFVDKADAANLRVDFVAVHYYQAIENPDNAQGAADQMYRFLKNIHDHVHRPVWITEFNNGANWTQHKPNLQQERAAINAMMKMLDSTAFVERYAIYNWVQETREMVTKTKSLTPAGEVYRNNLSPISFVQP